MADEEGTAADDGAQGVETVLSPAGACDAPVRESCDFRVEENRPCSFFGNSEQSLCQDSAGLPPDIPPETVHSGDSSDGLLSGRWLGQGRASITEAEVDEEDTEEERGTQQQAGHPHSASLALVSSVLPLKRIRLSVSPATGLIGLPENGFLNDFFECLGFIGIASEWAIRDAMVSVILATNPQRKTVSQPPLLPAEADEEGSDVVGITCQMEGRWSKAVPARSAALPRTTSTCLMWCAIALGALVRGIPCTHIKWYADLAEDSLDACSGSSTLDLARGHIAMAMLHSFLGDQAKNQGSLQCARDVLGSFPTDQVPDRLRDLAQYAGEGWDFERPTVMEKVALDGYWSDDVPFEKLPDIFGEEHALRFMLGVDRANTSLCAAARASVTKMYGPPPSSKVERSGEKLGDSVAAKHPAGLIHQDMLPELMRLKKYVERSEMRYGIGALIFYSTLYMAQAINEDYAGAIESFWRSLDVQLRYPGLFRINCWLHSAHTILCALAFGPHPERYEEVRAVYNMVRPEGSSEAPPYQEWTGISGICDHPDVFCRGFERPGSLPLLRGRGKGGGGGARSSATSGNVVNDGAEEQDAGGRED